MNFTLSEEDTRTLLQTARETIDASLARRRPAYPPVTETLRRPCGAFVTLKKRGQLRGCVGHVTSESSLFETVKAASIASAFEDPRFPPLSAAEWPGVRIEISVLSPLERIGDPSLIRAGIHGIKVRRGPCAGLLLPQVATEQGWDSAALLEHTCLKAGLPSDAWKDAATQIEIFTAIVVAENPH
jgi:AmmeMemoRadiSam system protein A